MFEKNFKEEAKQEIKNEGFPVYMDSVFCKENFQKGIFCKDCEYTFACNKVLERTLRKSIISIRETILENDFPINSQNIHSQHCKQHILTMQKCETCSNNATCYLEVLKFFNENINNGII